jgi:hypothetical protein
MTAGPPDSQARHELPSQGRQERRCSESARTARPKGSKDRLRAEASEEALSRVSERLAVAREGKWTGPESVGKSAGAIRDEGRLRAHQQTTGGQKRDASSQSQGARRQATRDSR